MVGHLRFDVHPASVLAERFTAEMNSECVLAKCGNCGFIGRWRLGILRPPDGRIHGDCPQCGATNLRQTDELPELLAFQLRMAGAPR